MAITTYAELSTAIANWLARADLTARIPEFIALVEADLNQNPDFELLFLESRATNELVVGEPAVALPADLKRVRNLFLVTDPRHALEWMPPAALTERFALQVNARPQAYTIIGDELRVAPAPESADSITIEYVATITAVGPGTKPANQKPLGDANPTNWILTNAPDIYLYGALATAEPYLGNDERLATWASLYGRAVGNAIRSDWSKRVTAGPIRRRAATPIY